MTEPLTRHDGWLLVNYAAGGKAPAPAACDTALALSGLQAMQANGRERQKALDDWIGQLPPAERDATTVLLGSIDPSEPDPAQAPPEASGASGFDLEMPPLPAAARLPERLAAGACPWLDEYVSFSRKWSPRAYDGFHQAIGLWVLSTVAARRVYVHVGKRRFPNLYIALAARTSIFAKSTTAQIGRDTLERAGLGWLLLADEVTPAKFLWDLAGHVPPNYDRLPPEDYARAKARLALPSQRGWFYEEFGQQLAAMNRDGSAMADFRGHLRRFDDCPETFEYGTIARGSEILRQPYLALLANLTPADLKPLARRGDSMWRDGFWARFAFVTPHTHEPKLDRFPTGERVIPTGLIKPLRQWHDRLGMPAVSVDAEFDAAGKRIGEFTVDRQPYSPVVCAVDDDVLEAFYTYHDALASLAAARQEEDLDGNYARFAEKALRIAVLLGSLANDNHIEIRHWARAQQIAEDWRAGLHALVVEINQPGPSQSERLEDRLLCIVQKLGKPTANEVSKYLRGVSAADAARLLDGLAAAGAVEVIRTSRNARRYQVA